MNEEFDELLERLAKSRRINASLEETTEEILSGVWAMIEEAQGGKKC